MSKGKKREAAEDAWTPEAAREALAPLAELICALALMRLDVQEPSGLGASRARERAKAIEANFSSGAPAIVIWREAEGGDMEMSTLGHYLAVWSQRMDGPKSQAAHGAFKDVAWAALQAMQALGSGKYEAAKLGAGVAFKAKPQRWAESRVLCLGREQAREWMAAGACDIGKIAKIMLGPVSGQDPEMRSAIEAAVLREAARSRGELATEPYALRL
jgi:hypothetical protein